ncbi:MAG: hypothetical protein RL208_568 [Pseudomonadota bacterium]|jgi:hypothetical protein
MQDRILKRIAIVVIAISIFSVGYVAGYNSRYGYGKKSYSSTQYHNDGVVVKKVRFWTSKKHRGEAKTKEESVVLDMFKTNLTKCLERTLSNDELENLKIVKGRVVGKIGKKDHSIEFGYDEIGDNEFEIMQLAKKVKKCKKDTKKHMTKQDGRLFRNAVSKMELKEVVDFFEGF